MRIAFDLTIIKDKNKITGIERVALETIKHMLTNDNALSKHTFLILCSYSGYPFLADELNVENTPSISLIQSPYKNRIISDQVWLPYIIKKLCPDYVYYTTLGVPLINFIPFAMIIHDAVAWAQPDSISKGMKYYYKPLIEAVLKHKKLDKVITVSEFSKNQIIEYLGVSASKIKVNHPGISANILSYCSLQIMSNELDKSEILEKYNIRNDYIVVLGTLEPRKNLIGLIKAFERLREKYQCNEKMVIVGRKGWIKDLPIHNDLKESIIFTGYVTDSELPYVLKHSKALVFPSLYEGFGLPLLEAMALGVPVISSNKASLPEIGQEACFYFDPYNIEEMADVIHAVLMGEEMRAEMSVKGINRAAGFTWEHHVHCLLEIFEEWDYGNRKII